MLAHAAVANPDPIFAPLEAVERAKGPAKDASEIYRRLRNRLWAAPPTAEVTVHGHLHQIHCRGDLEYWLDIANVDKGAAILAKFDEDQRAFDAKRKASGFDVALNRSSELDEIMFEAEYDVLEATPPTTAGAIALHMFTAEYLVNDMYAGAYKIVPALVNAAQSIAGAAPASGSFRWQRV